jgi:hypothetical protein
LGKIGKAMAETPELPYEFVRYALVAKAEEALVQTEEYKLG